MSQYLLEMKNISKQFPGVKALDDVSFSVRPGTVHALMGENGAGKSTLMKCLFGIYFEDAGDIIIDGEKVKFHHPRQALENGVAMVHQELNQVLKRNVMENIWLGRFPKTFGLVNHKKMYNDTKAIFDELGIDVDPKTVLNTLPVSQRQMVEIAKAVSYNSKIIVFDEPTSSLTEVEVEHLFRIINMLRDKGCGIVYISHRMEEILRISDDVTIMRDGKWVSTTPAKDLTMDSIIKQMVGRELTHRFPPKSNTPGDVIMQVRDLTAEYQNLQDVSFDLKKGEILGIAGLMGAGRTELLENLFGTATTKSGSVIFLNEKGAKTHQHDEARDAKKQERFEKTEARRKEKAEQSGKPYTPSTRFVRYKTNPQRAIKDGMALLTEERRATGIFGILSVRDNITIANIKNYRKSFYLSDKAMNDDSQWVVDAMKVKTPTLKTKIMSLSGGNQQKAIIGRWLLTKPDILLLDEPTRGIDVGAKYEIYQLMLNQANEGKSIIMVSSEMPELIGICDRILVMSGGRLAGEVQAETTTQEEIMALAAKYV